tara:strand:+ start:219 stop:431 length:213 start_codon:yes stop_codon:yes gene_type:complete
MTTQKKFSYKSSADAALNIASKVMELCAVKKAAHMGGALSITDFLTRLCKKIALWFSCFVGYNPHNINYN